MDKQKMYESFSNPEPEFGPGTYWFWQRIPTNDEIDNQLKEMVNAGYRTFFIQPRLAFDIDMYLSPEYLAAYSYAIEKAKPLGLKAGIYDDYNWNSGHAGGLTVKGHSEFREQQLFWTSIIITSRSFNLEITDIETLMGDKLGGPQGHWTYEGGKPIWADWRIIRACGYSENATPEIDHNIVNLNEYCEISGDGTEKCTIIVNLPNDELLTKKITVFIAARCITSRHINYLNKDATSRFIEVGYEPYKKAIGNHFGSTVFCMFMDHPHAGFYKWKQTEGNIKNSLMYDDSLPEIFQAEHNYPIEKSWLAFIQDESPLNAKYRGDFFNTYGRISRDFFLGQVSSWSNENGLLFAGHELFGFLGIWGFYGGYHVIDQRTDFGGDYFGIGKYKDLSTVDAYNSTPQIDAKIGDSIARANGQHGCMLEQYYYCVDPNYPGAIGHWNLSLDEMRSQALRHTFFGTKQYIFHGFYLSDQEGENELLASSKFDFSPGINFEPWFIHHSHFAKEIARLSSFIYNTDPVADIAVLYPLSTFWVEGSDGIMGNHSAIWHKWLLENGVGFDIINENQVDYVPSDPGILHAGPHRYSVLILPGLNYFQDISTAIAIHDFVKSGGKLYISGVLPKLSLDLPGDLTVKKIFENLLKENENVIFFSNESDLLENIPNLSPTITTNRPKVIKTDPTKGQLWSWLGKDESGYSIALFNDSDLANRATIKIPKSFVQPEFWDLQTGEIYKWLFCEKLEDNTNISIDLKPRQVVCIKLIETDSQNDYTKIIDSQLVVMDASSRENSTELIFIADRSGIFNCNLQMSKKDSFILDPKELITDLSGTYQFNIPTLPESIILDGTWYFSIPGNTTSKPIDIQSGWEQQGFENYKGEGIYENSFDIPVNLISWNSFNWKLFFPLIAVAACVYLNGIQIGTLPWPPYEIILPKSILQAKSNNLIVKVVNTAGNYYYSDSPYNVPKVPAGIIGFPFLKPIYLLTLTK